MHDDVPLGEYALDPVERSIQTLEVMGSGGRWRIEIIEIEDGRITRRWGEWDISDHTERDGRAPAE